MKIPWNPTWIPSRLPIPASTGTRMTSTWKQWQNWRRLRRKKSFAEELGWGDVRVNMNLNVFEWYGVWCFELHEIHGISWYKMASLMLLVHAFSWYSVLIYLRFTRYAFRMVLSYARGSWRFLEYLYYMGLSENMVYHGIPMAMFGKWWFFPVWIVGSIFSQKRMW